ncbi:MAG: glycosyltransferase [Chloroflexales bacterium]
MKISLILTVRGYEPLLEKTMALARARAGQEIEIVLVFDGMPHEKYGVTTDGLDTPLLSGMAADSIHILREPRGCMAARHAGIKRSRGRVCAVCDAHMGFSQNWAKELARFYRPVAHQHTVACACMRPAGIDLEALDAGVPVTAPYTGARLAWKTLEPVNGDPQHVEPSVLGAKWARHTPGERIGCIMGAFYTFTRAWYVEMGEPWQVGTGWGGDEELLSVVSYLFGGDVRLLPARIEVTHRMGDTAGNPDRWKPSMDDLDGVWLNRFRMVHFLPLSAPEATELQEHLEFNPHTQLRAAWEGKLALDRARPEVVALRGLWADKAAAWNLYRNVYIDRPAIDQVQTTAARWQQNRVAHGIAAPPMPITTTQLEEDPRYLRLPRGVVHRRTEVCSRCDARNPFRVLSSQGNRRYAKCRNCGWPVVILETGEQLSGPAIHNG